MTLPVQLSPRVAELRKKMQATRGRLIFALDATGSREPTWDMATQLQSQMFAEAARIGSLDVQLLYYCGPDGEEVQLSTWLSDAYELVALMSAIRCVPGATKIARVLRHIRTESEYEKVNAAIFIGDAVEEPPNELYGAAEDLGVPMFMFQEGDAQNVERVFCELARLTGGAYGKFDAGAAKQLGELLRAVAAFAAGGITALANQHTDSARRLLAQMKNGE